MGRAGRALVVHELLERTRDRWVLVVSVLFALLASAVSLYGRGADADAARLTGPSLVTLASLLVPLVALVLSHDAIVGERERNTLGLLLSLSIGRGELVVAKFLGRALAMAFAVCSGLGVAVALATPEDAGVLMALVVPTLLLGLAFLAIGILISASVQRQSAAASMVVLVWFGMVFFYDLGLLGLLVATDGALSQDVIATAVVGNPAGLYRLAMMERFAGPAVLAEMGLSASLPDASVRACLWLGWVLGPVGLSALLLSLRQVA